MQEARLRDIMGSLHESFVDLVKSSRGERLAAGRDDELWSGERRPGWQRALPCSLGGAALPLLHVLSASPRAPRARARPDPPHCVQAARGRGGRRWSWVWWMG